MTFFGGSASDRECLDCLDRGEAVGPNDDVFVSSGG